MPNSEVEVLDFRQIWQEQVGGQNFACSRSLEVASRARATTSSTNNDALCDFYRVYVYQRRVVKFEPGKR